MNSRDNSGDRLMNEQENPQVDVHTRILNKVLAKLYLTKGELDRAQSHFGAAIDYYMRVEDKDHLAHAKVGLAAVSPVLGGGWYIVSI